MGKDKTLLIVECESRELAEALRDEQWKRGREAYTLEEHQLPQVFSLRLMFLTAITLFLTTVVLLVSRFME